MHATRQIVISIQDVEIQSRKTSFCHQISRYWVFEILKVVILNGPSKFPYKIDTAINLGFDSTEVNIFIALSLFINSVKKTKIIG